MPRFKTSRVIVSAAALAGGLGVAQPALARDAFTGPRNELRGSFSELLANNYNAGYC